MQRKKTFARLISMHLIKLIKLIKFFTQPQIPFFFSLSKNSDKKPKKNCNFSFFFTLFPHFCTKIPQKISRNFQKNKKKSNRKKRNEKFTKKECGRRRRKKTQIYSSNCFFVVVRNSRKNRPKFAKLQINRSNILRCPPRRPKLFGLVLAKIQAAGDAK